MGCQKVRDEILHSQIEVHSVSYQDTEDINRK